MSRVESAFPPSGSDLDTKTAAEGAVATATVEPAGPPPSVLERLLAAYLAHRNSDAETFQDFTKRHSPEALRALAGERLPQAA